MDLCRSNGCLVGQDAFLRGWEWAWHCWPVVARTQRRRLSPEADARERLSTRLAELEQRLQRLEARVRVAGASRPVAPPRGGRSASRKAKAPAVRARCPGCRLELPRGRRGDSCVWCGFVFEAAAGSWPGP